MLQARDDIFARRGDMILQKSSSVTGMAPGKGLRQRDMIVDGALLRRLLIDLQTQIPVRRHVKGLQDGERSRPRRRHSHRSVECPIEARLSSPGDSPDSQALLVVRKRLPHVPNILVRRITDGAFDHEGFQKKARVEYIDGIHDRQFGDDRTAMRMYDHKAFRFRAGTGLL